MIKTFRVVAVSTNPNSFGLHGHILVARDGTAFEVARSIGSWNTPWKKGMDIEVNDYRFEGCEIPRQLENAPKKVLKEIFSS